jgi:maltooligosyltrehalose trehalohydrolase
MLNHALQDAGHHRVLFEFHKELIRLRKTIPALAYLSKETMDVVSIDSDNVLVVRRWRGNSESLTILNFKQQRVQVDNFHQGSWTKVLDSEDERWMGRGTVAPMTLSRASSESVRMEGRSVLLFTREMET